MKVWHLSFFRVEHDGRRIGGDAMTNGSTSLEGAIAEAKSIMQNRHFHFGKATVCVMKRQDGTIVGEVNADATRPQSN